VGYRKKLNDGWYIIAPYEKSESTFTELNQFIQEYAERIF
jgi:hypothetical protein